MKKVDGYVSLMIDVEVSREVAEEYNIRDTGGRVTEKVGAIIYRVGSIEELVKVLGYDKQGLIDNIGEGRHKGMHVTTVTYREDFNLSDLDTREGEVNETSKIWFGFGYGDVSGYRGEITSRYDKVDDIAEFDSYNKLRGKVIHIGEKDGRLEEEVITEDVKKGIEVKLSTGKVKMLGEDYVGELRMMAYTKSVIDELVVTLGTEEVKFKMIVSGDGIDCEYETNTEGGVRIEHSRGGSVPIYGEVWGTVPGKNEGVEVKGKE